MNPYEQYQRPIYPNQTSHAFDKTQLINAAINGAIIGGTGTAAMQIHKVQNQQVSLQQAANNTLKGAVQTGVAATAAAAAASLFSQNKAMSLVASGLAATAVMYYLNQPKQPKKDSEEKADA